MRSLANFNIKNEKDASASFSFLMVRQRHGGDDFSRSAEWSTRGDFFGEGFEQRGELIGRNIPRHTRHLFPL